ncbi:MAG: dTDP-4-amino-4,6-dideoxygalactose transaminase [Saprospiraceae bacterium]
MSIPFNIPVILGSETDRISEAIASKKLSGNGRFTKRCQKLFRDTYGFDTALLTTSCTDALELAAIICNISPGDEVIVPSYTYPSTANAFLLRGAKLVFVDSGPDHPNLYVEQLSELITPKTKAIVPVHYAGNACDMDAIMELKKLHGFSVIEDAAQAIGATHNSRPLGSIGDFGAFSFHDTKNINCGEGGMLCVNNKSLSDRAEIVWEKGTNRQAFLRGDIDKYGWVDIGSSYYPSELNAAFLSAQLEAVDVIQRKRVALWNRYQENFHDIPTRGLFTINETPSYSSNNAHIFYVVFERAEHRHAMIQGLKSQGIGSAFHYQSLHKSTYFKEKHGTRQLPNADRFSDCLLRLPLYYDLSLSEIDEVCASFEALISKL